MDRGEDESFKEVSEVKRKSRNLSEKKRRDSFNSLITELASTVSANNRKLDKSNILKQTIAFLRQNNRKSSNESFFRTSSLPIKFEHSLQYTFELKTQADSGHSPDSDRFRPPFLSSEEFLYLLLENLEAVVIVVTCDEQIVYVSDSLSEPFQLNQANVRGKHLRDLFEDHSSSTFRNAVAELSQPHGPKSCDEAGFYHFDWKLQTSHGIRQSIKVEGKFKSVILPDESCTQFGLQCVSSDETTCFMGVARCEHFPIIQNVHFPVKEKFEFTCKFNMEWKFIFVDQRAMNLIGYLPMEVLGLSGYEFYHVDDLDEIIAFHETLMKNGEAVSPPHRFRIKADRWIWLKAHCYIKRDQLNTKSECVVCTNQVLTDYVSMNKSTDIFESSSKFVTGNKNNGASTAIPKPSNVDSVFRKDCLVEKKVFHPQPGVSIEHSPISTNVGKKCDSLNQRKSKSTPNEEANAEHFEQLLQERMMNLQQQILQHERQLQTLQTQVVRSLTPEILHRQNVEGQLSTFVSHRFEAPPRPQSILQQAISSPTVEHRWGTNTQTRNGESCSQLSKQTFHL